MLAADLLQNAPVLARKFAAERFLTIDQYLDSAYAEKLYKFFAETMPEHWWSASYKGPTDDNDYKKTKFIKQTPANQDLIDFELKKCYNALEKGKFSYMFDRSVAHKQKCPCIECEFRKFLGGSLNLDLLSSITGQNLTTTNEFFASRFTAGHFLGPHHDLNKGKIGFILNLTKKWKPQYGGLLHMLEDDYITIKKVILPTFNKVTIFSIPHNVGVPHFVSSICPDINKKRISYTGWFN